MKMNESLFKETQKLADMGIKTRNMFEKSMFKPQFVADLQDSFSQITVAGKTLGERKGEIGEFFDGITLPYTRCV